MSEKTFNVNTVPSLTWNWMKMNTDSYTVNAEFSEAEGKINTLPKGITISEPVTTKLPLPGSAVCNFTNPKFGDDAENLSKKYYESLETHPLQNLIESVVNKAKTFTIEGKTEEPLILNFTEEKAYISKQIIHAKADSETVIIFVYKGNPKESVIQTTVYAEENAKVKLIKVQLLGTDSYQIDDTQIVENDNASVQFIQLELGGLHVDSGLHTTLAGYQSYFNSKVAYLCQENQYLDMNHIVYHTAAKTECKMDVNGTIKDNAVKTYRGTIDFKKGCCGSKGNEMEETLVLSPKAVNKSLPVILCDEEDVEGEHGATIGRLSGDVLFYMQSRGIDEKSAEQLMSKAKVQAVADLIPNEDLQNEIAEYLESKLNK